MLTKKSRSVNNKVNPRYLTATENYLKSVCSDPGFPGLPDNSVQDEPAFQDMIGRDVYNKKGHMVGFVDSVFFSKEAVTVYRIVGVNQYLGTGKCHLDQFHLIDGRLILDMVF